MDHQQDNELDHLAIGLTKSPMFMGINVRLFFANVVLCTLICIDAHTILGVPLFIFLHVVMVVLSLKEPNFLSLYFKAFTKAPPVLNRWHWGKINSYGPW